MLCFVVSNSRRIVETVRSSYEYTYLIFCLYYCYHLAVAIGSICLNAVASIFFLDLMSLDDLLREGKSQ